MSQDFVLDRNNTVKNIRFMRMHERRDELVTLWSGQYLGAVIDKVQRKFAEISFFEKKSCSTIFE